MTDTLDQARSRADITASLAAEVGKTHMPMVVKVFGLRGQKTLKELSQQLATKHGADSLSAKLAPLPAHLASIVTNTRKDFNRLFLSFDGMVWPALDGVAYLIPSDKAAACAAAVRQRIHEYDQALWEGVMGATPRNATEEHKQLVFQQFKTEHIEPKCGGFMQQAFPFTTVEEYLNSAYITFKPLPVTEAQIDPSMVMAAEIQAGVNASYDEMYEALIQSVERVVVKIMERVQNNSKPFSTNTFNAMWRDLQQIQASMPSACLELHNALRVLVGDAHNTDKNCKFLFDTVCSLPDDPKDATNGKHQNMYRQQMVNTINKASNYLRVGE